MALALLASPGLGQYLFDIVLLSDGVNTIDGSNVRVTDSGIIAAEVGGEAAFYTLSNAAYTTLAGPTLPPGEELNTVMGKTSGGYIAVDVGQGYQGVWYYDTSAWQNPALAGGAVEYRFNDQNETHAVAASWEGPPSPDTWLMEFSTGSGTALTGLNVKKPWISTNGYVAGDDPVVGNGGILWDPNLNGGAGDTVALNVNAKGVNASGNTAGIDPLDGLMYHYNHGSSIYTLIPELTEKPVASGYTYEIVGLSDNDEVIGLIRKDTFKAWGFYWTSTGGTHLLTDLIDPTTAPNEMMHPTDDLSLLLYDYAQLTDINAGGIIGGRGRSGNGGYYRAFALRSKSIAPTPKNRGDVTEDLFVGADDLVRILTHWGQTGVGWTDGDVSPYNNGIITGDDFVGADDYVEVLSMWGTNYPTEPGPTPEPATLGVLLLGGLIGIVRRK